MPHRTPNTPSPHMQPHWRSTHGATLYPLAFGTASPFGLPTLLLHFTRVPSHCSMQTACAVLKFSVLAIHHSSPVSWFYFGCSPIYDTLYYTTPGCTHTDSVHSYTYQRRIAGPLFTGTGLFFYDYRTAARFIAPFTATTGLPRTTLHQRGTRTRTTLHTTAAYRPRLCLLNRT